MDSKNFINNRGQVMMVVVLVLSGIIIGSTAVAGLMMVRQTRQTVDAGISSKTIFAADAGLEWRINKFIRDDYTCINDCTGNQSTSGSCAADFACLAQQVTYSCTSSERFINSSLAFCNIVAPADFGNPEIAYPVSAISSLSTGYGIQYSGRYIEVQHDLVCYDGSAPVSQGSQYYGADVFCNGVYTPVLYHKYTLTVFGTNYSCRSAQASQSPSFCNIVAPADFGNLAIWYPVSSIPNLSATYGVRYGGGYLIVNHDLVCADGSAPVSQGSQYYGADVFCNGVYTPVFYHKYTLTAGGSTYSCRSTQPSESPLFCNILAPADFGNPEIAYPVTSIQGFSTGYGIQYGGGYLEVEHELLCADGSIPVSQGMQVPQCNGMPVFSFYHKYTLTAGGSTYSCRSTQPSESPLFCNILAPAAFGDLTIAYPVTSVPSLSTGYGVRYGGGYISVGHAVSSLQYGQVTDTYTLIPAGLFEAICGSSTSSLCSCDQMPQFEKNDNLDIQLNTTCDEEVAKEDAVYRYYLLSSTGKAQGSSHVFKQEIRVVK